jgi:DNA-binding NtrC family response regulator
MAVRTEFEIRFIFDATKPLPADERHVLLAALDHAKGLRTKRGAMFKDILDMEDIVRSMPEPAALPDPPAPAVPETAPDVPLTNATIGTIRAEAEAREATLIRETFLECGCNVSETARRMGYSRQQMGHRMDQLGIHRPGRDVMANKTTKPTEGVAR